MTRYSIGTLALLVGLAGCGGSSKEGALAAADSLDRDLAMPAAESTAVLNDLPAPAPATPPVVATRPPATRPASTPPAAPAPAPAPAPPAAPPAAVTSTLAAGTRLEVKSDKAITSRTNKAGESFTATVAEAVSDPSGRVVIPAGATVTFLIEALAPAANRGDTTGTLRLRATTVAFDGNSYPMNGGTTTVAYTLKGRGITTGTAAKVGIGAAAGAVAGRVLGGGSRGSVVGGVVGAATGAAVAAETADRDVVIDLGARIVVSLTAALTLPRA